MSVNRTLPYDFYQLGQYHQPNTEPLAPAVNNVSEEWINDFSLRRPSYVSTLYILSYVLVILAIAFITITIIVLRLTLGEASGNSLVSVASYPLRDGTCESGLLTYNYVAHFFINFLGTIILGISNYIQQICTSPTIRNIAIEMQRNGDMSFGANSPSALSGRGSPLAWLWFSLVATSLPIHLTLNGIVGYAVFPINNATGQTVLLQNVVTLDYGADWTNITADQCITYLVSSYAYVLEYDNLTVVLNPEAAGDYNDYDGLAAFPAHESTAPDFLPSASDIANCYVHYIVSKCELTIRWLPLVCTSATLLTKSLVILIALRRHPHFRQRVYNSLGDMIALGARHQFQNNNFQNNVYPRRGQKVRWVQALGKWDVLVAVFWWTSALGVSIAGAITFGNVTSGLSFSAALKLFGIGSINYLTSFVPGQTNPAHTGGTPETASLQIIIANSPQLWLSLGYLLWNNQITRIWMEREWRSFYCNRKKPRISYHSKEIGVRATRWLQLPYWLTAILMVISTLMHFLVSQTLFVVEILGATRFSGYFFTNYSPLAIFAIGIIATILVLGITIYYYIPIRTNMPLMAGSARVVFDSCSGLSTALPVGGIAWGDISTPIKQQVGFGETVRPLLDGDPQSETARQRMSHNVSDARSWETESFIPWANNTDQEYVRFQ